MMRKIESDERRPSPDGAASLATALEIPAAQQNAFLQVARQERAVDRLGAVDQDEVYPWEAPARPRTNLPVPATLFVGREKELAQLSALLADPACRLVTLVGLAGIGKTRLAIQAARNEVARFADGVFFVPLAPLDSPEMITITAGRAIGFQFQGAAEPKEQLLGYLQQKRMLLLLDNFEHLVDGTDLLVEIVAAVPGLQLLVTSRERLNLQSEWLFPVAGLPYPPPPDERSLERVEAYSAIRLFLQSALRVDARFGLTEEKRESLVRICRQLEGIPLGIELAAAWVRILALQEIATEIQKNVDFLKVSARDIPERHRSLRAALDHSWNLLTAREKAVLRRLAAFRGGFGREAAQQVAGAGLEELASLLDKSLLKRVGEERYDLHELVRQYAITHLQAAGQEYDQTHDLHSSYYAQVLEQWETPIRSPRQAEMLTTLDAEMANVRLAWSWMVRHRQLEKIQRSLNCLWCFYTIRTRLREAAGFFGQAAALKSVAEAEEDRRAEHAAVVAQLLARQAFFSIGLDRREEGRELLEESLALLRASGEHATLAETLGVLGFVKFRLGAFEEARRFSEESLELLRGADNPCASMFCLVTLAYVCLEQASFEEAYAFSNESLMICRDILGDPQGTGVSLTMLSQAANRLGRYAEARRLAEESLQIARSVNDLWGLGIILRQLALIDLELGETQRAMSLFQQSVARFREVGDSLLMAMSLLDMGATARASGAYAASKAHCLEALQTGVDTTNWDVVVNAVTDIAATDMVAGATQPALELVLQCQLHLSASQEVTEKVEEPAA